MNRSLALLLAVVASSAFGCRSVPVAHVPPGTRISVVLDRAITKEMPAQQSTAQGQLGDWMERDLLSVLSQAGFQVEAASAKQGGAASHVLTVRIVRYNPGSTAARMFVGFGAGSAALDIQYELRQGGKVLLSKADGMASGVDWRKIARKLDLNMTREVSAAFAR